MSFKCTFQLQGFYDSIILRCWIGTKKINEVVLVVILSLKVKKVNTFFTNSVLLAKNEVLRFR